MRTSPSLYNRLLSLLITATPIAMIVVACANADILTPPSGPGTAYPCGVSGISCGHHRCCDPPFTVCGGPFTGCGEYLCCMDNDPGMFSARPDAGPHSVPQRQIGDAGAP